MHNYDGKEGILDCASKHCLLKDLSGGLPRRKTRKENMAPEVSKYLNWSSFQLLKFTAFLVVQIV